MSACSNPVSSLSLDNLFSAEAADDARYLISVAQQYGVTLHVTSVTRTFEEQTYYYNLRLKGQWPYPVAKPGTSAHEYGFAFDLSGGSHADLAALRKLWSSWGGITFDYDPVHFQFPGFSPPTQLQNVRPAARSQAQATFDQLADLLLYFVPVLGQVLSKAQLASALIQILSGSTSDAAWYIQHPIEALRDLQDWLISLAPDWLQPELRLALGA